MCWFPHLSLSIANSDNVDQSQDSCSHLQVGKFPCLSQVNSERMGGSCSLFDSRGIGNTLWQTRTVLLAFVGTHRVHGIPWESADGLPCQVHHAESVANQACVPEDEPRGPSEPSEASGNLEAPKRQDDSDTRGSALYKKPLAMAPTGTTPMTSDKNPHNFDFLTVFQRSCD